MDWYSCLLLATLTDQDWEFRRKWMEGLTIPGTNRESKHSKDNDQTSAQPTAAGKRTTVELSILESLEKVLWTRTAPRWWIRLRSGGFHSVRLLGLWSEHCRHESCPVTRWHTCQHTDAWGWSLFTSPQRPLQSQTISDFIIPLFACTSMSSSQALRLSTALNDGPHKAVHLCMYACSNNRPNEVCRKMRRIRFWLKSNEFCAVDRFEWIWAR